MEMQIYSSISELIADIEAEAARYDRVASENHRDRERRSEWAAISHAAAYRELASRMRDTFIGTDAANAKPLAECR